MFLILWVFFNIENDLMNAMAIVNSRSHLSSSCLLASDIPSLMRFGGGVGSCHAIPFSANMVAYLLVNLCSSIPFTLC